MYVGILFLSVLLLLLLLFLVFLVRERRSSLYIRLSLFSLFARFFSFVFTLIDATYMQNFSSPLLLLVGQAFLFVVASVRSLVRSNSNNKQ